MANEFPKLSEVFKIGTEVTYDEAIEKVFLPQDNAVKSIPSISPIETVTLTGNKIVPTAFLVQIQIVENLSNELHFIDYTNLRDGAILQLRILDNNNPIVIKNGISGVGSIMTADGNDIELNDYRTIVQLQLEGTLWRQVGGIQAQADWNQVDSKKPDFIKNKPTNLLDSTRITNCITEIPQDVKLELADGVLTLKAGSKVYVPNGAGRFDIITISADKTETASSMGLITGSALIFARIDTQDMWAEVLTESGTGTPTNPWTTYYNTNDNKVYRYSDNITTPVYQGTFPIAKVSFSNSTLTSIDQVFNGFGYIGSTVFALPGVKGLIPNGRNEDGSLKNNIFSVTNVIPITINSGPNGIKSIYFTTSGGIGITSSYTYDLQKNILLDTEDNSIIDGCIAINFVWDNSQQTGQKITSFNSKTTFRAFDQNDSKDKFVHKTGDEEINGTKTFLSAVHFKYGDYNTRIAQQGDGNFVIYKNGKAIIACHNEEILTAPNNANATITHSVVTTTGISKTETGFLKLGNGIIFQWGYANNISGNTTITLPIAFSSNNYSVTLGLNESVDSYASAIVSKTNTNFVYRANSNRKSYWIAIGY